MAQIQEVRLVDDLDGGDAEESMSFGIDGKVYEIDLSGLNSKKLRDAMAPYLAAARRMSGRSTGKRPASHSGVRNTPTVDREQNQAIRDWAAKKGIKIAERGRIPGAVQEAYQEDHRPRRLAPVPAPVEPPQDEIVKWYVETGRKFPVDYKGDGKATPGMKGQYSRAMKKATANVG